MKPMHHHIRILNRLRKGFGTAVLLGILIPQLAIANPLGPQVVSGQASFAAQGKTLSVTNSDRAIINWQDFSVGNGELTRFIQPTATSAVLNRVIGNNPSAIYGALQSNGRVYLVNQNGIFIGPAATIDVNGLIASTLNIADGDFKAGRINFSGGPLSGRIENQGAIRTPAGGSIYLIAPDVTNSGIINAPNGDILLAAGQQVSLVESTTPEIAVVVSAPGNQALNLGRIIAEAGRIGIYGGLIRHRGIVSADSAVMDKTGAIHFRATNDITFDKDSSTTANGPKGGSITVQSAEGTTLVSGAVEAKGSSDKGGTVQLLGRRVGVIDAAQIDASGGNGGGTVLIGGDYQGKNPAVQNAEATYFGTDASIRADAAANGDGGKVILWGDNATRAYGSIFARGGANGGNGGFVETSGKYLDYRGFADLRAPRGKTGTLLLDPTNIYIAVDLAAAAAAGMTGTDASADGSGAPDFNASGTVQDSLLTTAMLQASLAGASTVVSTANGTGTGTGDIYVVNPVNWTTGYSLTLNANRNIAIDAAITGSSAESTLTLNAPGSITQSAGIAVYGLELLGYGAYTLDYATNSIDLLAGNVGSLSLKNSGAFSVGTIGGTIGITAAGTGGLTLNTVSGGITVSSPINGPAATGNLTLNAVDGGITVSSPINWNTAKSLTLQSLANLGSGSYYVSNSGNITGGTLTLQSDDKPASPGPASPGSISGTGIISVSNLELLGGGLTNVTLNNASNSIGTLAGYNVHDLSLTNKGPLTIGKVNSTDGLAATGGVTLNVTNSGDIAPVPGTGNITITSGLSATGDVTLTADSNININEVLIDTETGVVALNATGGTINETTGGIEPKGAVWAATLNTTSKSGQSLDGGNMVSSFSATNTGSGEIKLVNTAPGPGPTNTLTITGINQNAAGANISINNTGDINITGTIAGPIGGGAVTNLTASGEITQDMVNGRITTTGLVANAAKDMTLNGPNSLTNFSGTITSGGMGEAGGSIVLKNVGTGVITIGNITNDTSGLLVADSGITIDSTGGININGLISTASGGVSLVSSAGPITAVSAVAKHVTGSYLSADAQGGIGTLDLPLKTTISTLYATIASADPWGDIVITNTGALNINTLVSNGSGTMGGGNIQINNTGSVTTGGSLVRGYGDVTIIANSPLTIGTGGVTSNTGDINLTAGVTGPGMTGDILTLNGNLAGVDITLSAGNEIIHAPSTAMTYTGALIESPNLNGPAPPPTCSGGQYWDGTACVCPSGQSVIGGVCQPITCPTGQQLVGNTCQAITCPMGQQLVGNTCQPITCPAGQDLVGNTCHPITCPTGQDLVGNTCQAITCPTGQDLVGNTCQAITCSTGQQLVGNTCQAITCPTGQQLVGNACQAITCPTGQQLVGNTCQAITCPTGQQLVGNTCQAITCPTGQQLVGNACQAITCPTGQQLVGNACQAITCPTGQQLVGNTCQAITCPTGQQLVGNTCQAITCPTGQQLVGNTCQAITCPTGQQLVGNTCQTITCPTGQQLVGNTCQAITCPTGQQLVGNTCQAITCPTGQQLVGNTCQAITCPTGQQLVGNTCQAITCPTGQQLVRNTCQAITCPTGQELFGNLCQPISCPGGQVFIGAGCQCPAGTIDYAGGCKIPSIVPGTDTTTVIYFPVTEELSEPLQVLEKSIINAVAPSFFRTSGSGSSGGGAGDDFKPKKNYCN